MAKLESLWDALNHWAATTPGKVVIRAGDRSLTYAQLAAAAEGHAHLLRSNGTAQGDRVILVGHNTIEWLVAYLAIIRLGAIVVPANNRISSSQMADLVELLGSNLALADEQHHSMFAETDIRVMPLAGVASTRLEGDLPPLPATDLPALISFTSGTTGQPKGAVLSGSALFKASAVFYEVFETSHVDSTVIIAPLFHNTGFVDQFGQMLIAGGEVTLVEEFHRNDAIAAFRESPATFVTAVPSVLRMLMLMDEADYVFGPARTVLFGGSPMPAAWSREMFERWPHLKLAHGYGLTEFGSACSFLPSEEIEAHGESVGYAAPGVDLRIVDDAGHDVQPGEIGEVWAAGPTRMIEYWRRPDATAAKLSGQWLRTGDLGRTDSEGRLFLDGRSDDVINRGGEKILPSHLESLLAERSDVGSCLVVGIPHPVLQQIPVAALEVRPGQRFDEDGARAHMKARLPGYAVPAQFVVFDSLPRIASGKIDRRAVRDAIIAGLSGLSPIPGVSHEP